MLALRSEEFAFQLAACIGFLNPARELILCKYKIGVVSMKIVIGRCYVKFFTGLLFCAEN